MRVGVFPGDFAPQEGGGHTFVATVFEAFLRQARASRHEFVVLSEPARAPALGRACNAAGVAHSTLPARGALELALAQLKHYPPLAYLLRKAPLRLERACRRHGIEVLWFLPGLAYEAVDVPYVATIWDLQHRLLPWFPEASHEGYWEHREMLYARFVRRAAHVLTGTEVGAAQLCSLYGIPRERVSVLPQPAPALDGDESQPSPALRAATTAPYVLYPAQFWAHKNHVNLLHALQLLESRDGVRLAAIFPGADKGNLAHVKRACSSLALEDRVHFPGFVTAQDLRWLYRHALCLAYPSFNGPDNLPPLEAFALGCPVALADYPGAAEQAGEAALLFDPGSPEDMARALARLASEPALREELVRRGRERVARWSGEDYVRGVLEVLDALEPVRRCWS